jgi:alkylation response protein AidB-like acyl-CoA dehydrogenase
MLRFFAKEGLKTAARAVGLCQSALGTSLEYVSNRKAFGKPIGHFQAIAFTLADRSMDVDAARTLVWQAAARWDHHEAKPTSRSEKEALLASAFAISFALESAMKAGDCAVQLHGGAGFIRDYIVEKLMRDAKQLQVCFLTSEQADQIAATLELGLPLDPAVVLPTPETQSVFT